MDPIPTYSVDDFLYEEPLLVDGKPESRPLVGKDYLIRQTFSKKGEPGVFLENPPLFDLDAKEIVKIELYIWLEGQDVDCSNAMSDGVTTTQIEANIQFTGTTETQSGMRPLSNQNE